MAPYTAGSLMGPSAAKNQADHAMDFACRDQHGKPLIYTLPDQLVRMDPSTRFWQEAVANTTRAVQRAGKTDGIYLDQTASYCEQAFLPMRLTRPLPCQAPLPPWLTLCVPDQMPRRGAVL